MTSKIHPAFTKHDAERYARIYRSSGSIRGAAEADGITLGKSGRLYRKAVGLGLLEKKAETTARDKIKGKIKAPRTPIAALTKGGITRYLLTCAQNDTRLFEAGWQNLTAFADFIGARILVARSVYDTGAPSSMETKKRVDRVKRLSDFQWHPAFDQYIHDDRLRLAPGLVWAGELNVLPTAENPLSSLEAYTGRDSMIMPHARLAMRSVHSGQNEATKLMYTTGTMTQRNYIQRKAGQKAEFHHCYGALLVEVAEDGTWFCRQINMDSEGTIYDLDKRVKNGVGTNGHRVESISWGDIHEARMADEVRALGWENSDSMFNVLRPKHQFIHDLLDFWSRNHHEMKNPHKMFKKHILGVEDVRREVDSAMAWLGHISSPDCRTVVVDSNHNNALTRWLASEDGRQDPVNAVFWLRANLALYQAIERGDNDFHMMEDLYGADAARETNVLFLHEGESYIISKDRSGGQEMGMHGDLGFGGTRGSPGQFRKMGRKSVTAHGHGTGIFDGNYINGTSSQIDLGYNRGPGNWSWSHTVTYENGKRAIYTMFNDKWRA